MRKRIIFIFVLCLSCVPAYAQKKTDPVKTAKDTFLERYGFFMTGDKKTSSYQEALGITDKEDKIFKKLKTIDEINKFSDIFWKIRDTDPNTPENEYKIQVDRRIEDILNDTHFLDLGILFRAHGGLKSDLARVYMFYGAPNCYNEKMVASGIRNELLVWYYCDQAGQHVFRFLFINKFGGMSLFRKHIGTLSGQFLFDPTMSPLRDLSIRFAPNQDELLEVWYDLERNDSSGAFRLALLEFSYFSDIHIDNVLRAPEPAMLTASYFKPVILGQPPETKSKVETISSSKNSQILATVNIRKDNQSGKFSFGISGKYSDMDWEVIKDPGGDSTKDNIEAELTLTITFQELKSKEITKFKTGAAITVPRSKLDNNDRLFNASFDALNDQSTDKPGPTLAQIVAGLKPGTYKVDFHLVHKSKKSLIWSGYISIS